METIKIEDLRKVEFCDAGENHGIMRMRLSGLAAAISKGVDHGAVFRDTGDGDMVIDYASFTLTIGGDDNGSSYSIKGIAIGRERFDGTGWYQVDEEKLAEAEMVMIADLISMASYNTPLK